MNPFALTSTVVAVLLLHFALLRLRASRDETKTGAPPGSVLHLVVTALATVAGLGIAILHFMGDTTLGMYLFWPYIALGGASTLFSFNALDAELIHRERGGRS